MFWIIVGLIVCYVVYKMITKKESESNSEKTPPSEWVYIFGCSGNSDCGYWSPEMGRDSNGEIIMNVKKCYCAYKKQWFKEGDECPFAKEHPELVVSSNVFNNMNDDNTSVISNQNDTQNISTDRNDSGSCSDKSLNNIVGQITGKCGDNVCWTLSGNGALEIIGTGAMYDYKPNTEDNGKNVTPWYPYRMQIRSVQVDKRITHLSHCAFAYCQNLEKVELLCTIEDMPWLGFFECEKLCTIIVPQGVNRIQSDCFLECSSLRSVKLPEGINEIGDNAFYNCKSLETINLPESLTDINEYAFAFCFNLKSIRIPRNTSYIHEKAFFKSGVTVRPRK